MRAIKKNLVMIGAVVAILGVLVFVGCFAASMIIWTPGTPSATAQTLTVIAAFSLPVSMLGLFIATLD